MSGIRVTWMTKQTIGPAAALLGVDLKGSDAAEYLRYMNVRSVLVRVALDGSRVVGAIRYVIEGGTKHIDVKDVVVAADRRREGIGGKLLDAIRAELDGLRPTLWLAVPEDNMGALLWLRAYGGWDAPVLGHGGEGEPDVVWFRHSIKAREEVAA